MIDTCPQFVADFNRIFVADAKPGDAERLHAEAARLRARACNATAAAYRIEGRVGKAQEYEAQAASLWELAAGHERNARIATA